MKELLAILVLAACTSDTGDRESVVPLTDSGSATAFPPASSLRVCGVTPATHVSGRGLGDLEIGGSVDEIRRLCNVVRDTVVQSDEATNERVLDVGVAGDTLTAIVESGKVWRIELDRSTFRTSDSLGVNTPLRRLLEHPGLRGFEGEGVLYVAAPSLCGLSFALSYIPADQEHRVTWTHADLRQLPAETRVERLLVIGCGNR